jgi:ATP-dependent exoDNAse (exonuclease V) alpha subunit
VSQYQGDTPQLPADIANQISARLYETKLIIIDEVSMAGYPQFMQIDTRMKQILCVGDFRQLKPVGDRPNYIFSTGRSNSIRNLSSSLRDNFRIFELTEITRQRDDQPFVVALNNMASGTMTDEDIRLLKECQVKNERDVPRSALCLFRSKAEVDT